MIDVEVEDPAWETALPQVEALTVRAAEAALHGGLKIGTPFPLDGGKAGIGGVGTEPPQEMPVGADQGRSGETGATPPSPTLPPSRGKGDSSVVVLLTDDATVRDLNHRFRHKDAPTNVLSFPAAPNPEGHLGDIALAYGVCAREAGEQGKPFAHHVQHLVAHGVLHLLGYDHMTDDEAQEMEGLERVVLAGLGVSDPYAGGREGQ